MSSDNPATISAEQSFLVHLQSLLDFARELDGQFQAVRRPTDDLASLANLPVLLGDFAEAGALRAQYAVAARQMYELLDAVRGAIGFADDVTKTISDSYQHYDHHIAGLYGQHKSDSLEAGGNPAAARWVGGDGNPGSARVVATAPVAPGGPPVTVVATAPAPPHVDLVIGTAAHPGIPGGPHQGGS